MLMGESDYHKEDFGHIGIGVVIYPPCLILKPGVISLGDYTRIDAFTRLEGGRGITIGHHTHLSSFASIYAGGEAIIGNFVGIAQGARIITGQGFPFSADFPVDFTVCDPYFRSGGVTTINDYAIIGSNSVVLPGITIGEGGIVGAGSVVTTNVAPWTYVCGVPAKFLKVRQIPNREEAEQ